MELKGLIGQVFAWIGTVFTATVIIFVILALIGNLIESLKKRPGRGRNRDPKRAWTMQTQAWINITPGIHARCGKNYSHDDKLSPFRPYKTIPPYKGSFLRYLFVSRQEKPERHCIHPQPFPICLNYTPYEYVDYVRHKARLGIWVSRVDWAGLDVNKGKDTGMSSTLHT